LSPPTGRPHQSHERKGFHLSNGLDIIETKVDSMCQYAPHGIRFPDFHQNGSLPELWSPIIETTEAKP